MTGKTPRPLVPKLRFPEFEDAAEWEQRTMGNLGVFIRGLTYSAADVADAGLLVLRSSNIQDGRLVLDSDLVHVAKECPPDLLLREGDVAICMSNGSKALVGKHAEYRGGYEGEITVGAFCSIFRATNTFAKLAFATDAYSDFVALGIAGGNINNLKNADLEAFEFYVPRHREEQQKIADCLGSLDDLIAAESRKLDALRRHKQGLMQQLFPRPGETVPRLRFPEFRDMSGWIADRFSNLYTFQRNNTLSRDKLNYKGGPAKNVHYGDIHTKFRTHFDITREAVPYINQGEAVPEADSEDYCVEGDLIFADASEDTNDVGKCIEVVELNGERLLSGQHTILARRSDNRLAVGFGGYLMRSTPIRTQIEKEAQGTKVYAISAARLGIIEVPFPPEQPEQEKIVDCLASIDAIIDAQRERLDSLQSHKQGLMQQLFPRPKEEAR